ncbi:hypothetical protein [Pseudomonas maioricensis]|uniref:hypothetical protein n=1 Tax=Pseudomonas maioricensis TaxID=1766623 RepID=UPI001FAD9D79|nr:hypothetical protein [Pseudomonas sp. S25]
MRFELDVSVMPERYVLRVEGCTLKFESERAAELFARLLAGQDAVLIVSKIEVSDAH